MTGPNDTQRHEIPAELQDTQDYSPPAQRFRGWMCRVMNLKD